MIPKRLRAKRGEEFLSCSILESLEIGSLAIPWVHKSLFARVVKWESSKRALITRPAAAASEAVEEAVSIFLVGEFVSLYVRKICILLRPYEIFGWLLPACQSAHPHYCQSRPFRQIFLAASGRTRGICAKAPSSSWCSSFCAVFNNESLSLEFTETSRGRCGQWNVTLHIVT